MHIDLQSAQVIVGVVIGLLTILGTIFGWFGKAWRWAASLFKPKPMVGVIEVPVQDDGSRRGAAEAKAFVKLQPDFQDAVDITQAFGIECR